MVTEVPVDSKRDGARPRGLTNRADLRPAPPAPLEAANLGVEKLRRLFRLAFNLKCLDERRYEYAAERLDEIGRLIGGWRKASRAHAETP